MLNFVMFVLGLGFVSEIPKPDLISVDIGTFQVGGGIILHFPRENENHSLLPDLGLSIGQARAYWGKKLAFVAGLELFRGELAYAPSDYTVAFGTYEVLTPEVGMSILLGPERNINPKGCLNPFYRQNFVPRLDLTCGFSPLNMFSIGPLNFSPTLRVEARLLLTRSTQIVFENRNIWGQWPVGYWSEINTLNLALCFALGGDYLINKGGESEQKSE